MFRIRRNCGVGGEPKHENFLSNQLMRVKEFLQEDYKQEKPGKDRIG